MRPSTYLITGPFDCNGNFDHWFGNIKNHYVTLGIIIKIELYHEPSEMHFHSSIHGCVVNGRNAMRCVHE